MDVLCRVATEDESSKLQQFLVEHYFPNLEFFTCIGMSTDAKEVKDFLQYSLHEGLTQQTTIVATNPCGEIVGLCLNHLDEDISEYFVSETETSESTSESPVKVLMAFEASLRESLETLIPAECKRLLLISMLSVDKRFGRQGIGRKLLEASTENAKKIGFDGAIALSVSRSSQALFSKLGYSVLRVVRHDEYLDEEGTRLINCKDGTEEGRLVFLKL